MDTNDDTIPFIDDLVEDFNKVQEIVLPEEPTTAQNLSVHLTKILMLACASYYEQQLQEAYTNYAQRESERQLKAFQEIFAIRNLIAHQTFVEFSSNRIRGKSFSDIKQMHEDALEFVKYLKSKFV